MKKDKLHLMHLKKAVSSAPALHPIDYSSSNPVILAVDSSYIATGIVLLQLDDQGRRRPARYGSIPMDEREARYSLPKLDLYALYRALRHYRIYLFGVKHLIAEDDAGHIKGMLNEPDLQPNATIKGRMCGILLFDFILKHVPAEHHLAPDALSRKRRAEEDSDYSDEDDDRFTSALLSLKMMKLHKNWTGRPRRDTVVHTLCSDKQLEDPML
jgi:hypothetical protein